MVYMWKNALFDIPAISIFFLTPAHSKLLKNITKLLILIYKPLNLKGGTL
jgi:hypothetical protein